MKCKNSNADISLKLGRMLKCVEKLRFLSRSASKKKISYNKNIPCSLTEAGMLKVWVPINLP
jgi:hypothetical protein